MIKYVHARLPGRELIHLVPPHGLNPDPAFRGHDEYVRGAARTLCGKPGHGWVVGSGRSERCPACFAKR